MTHPSHEETALAASLAETFSKAKTVMLHDNGAYFFQDVGSQISEQARLLVIEALRNFRSAPPPAEPVAWRYELATTMEWKDGKAVGPAGYGGWKWHLTEYEPQVPEGSLRNLTPLYAALTATAGGQDREAIARASTLARRLCQLFDSGGESQRSVRARHASAIFQMLASYSTDVEQRICDDDPVRYLKKCEEIALARSQPKTRPLHCASVDPICHHPACSCVGTGSIQAPAQSQPETDGLRTALESARKAIASLDAMALGGQEANHPEDQEWYYRDELLSHIDKALAASCPCGGNDTIGHAEGCTAWSRFDGDRTTYVDRERPSAPAQPETAQPEDKS